MEQIRSFIAIELPGNIKESIRKWQDILKSGDPSGAKWVNPDSIHLTLKFLGNIDTQMIEAITQSMKEAAQPVVPFQLVIKETGAFPNLRRAQVIWLGLGGELEKLHLLQRRLECGLSALGFPEEKRAFSPHLTLARIHNYTSNEKRMILGNAVAGVKIEPNLFINVNSINLMRSQLTRSGAIYSRLCSVEL